MLMSDTLTHPDGRAAFVSDQDAALRRWTHDTPGPIKTGSDAHRKMFCRMLRDTHDPYRPAVLDWPKRLFRPAQRSGFFPVDLVETFLPVIQEEARHILFFVNWIAYCRARQSLPQRVAHTGRCALAMTLQIWTRVKTAIAAARGGGDDSAENNEDDDFMLGVKDSLEVVSSPRQFLQVCLRENDRRLAQYDPRLLRPTFVPAIARTLSRVLR